MEKGLCPKDFDDTVAQTEKLSRKDVKELVKHDAFRERTLGTVEYISEHKSQVTRYIAIAVAAAVLIGGFFWYRSYSHSVRQEKLQALLNTYGATVTSGEAPPFAARVFKTEDEKTAAIRSEFKKFADENSGSDEAAVANYYLGIHWAEAGNNAEAEKHLKAAVAQGSAAYSSLAKIALAQYYAGQGKTAEGVQLMDSLIASPTALVSKEHATIEKARLLVKSNPAEARKLLEPLRTSPRAPISQQALQILSDIK